MIGRYFPIDKNDGSCTSICAVKPENRPQNERVDAHARGSSSTTHAIVTMLTATPTSAADRNR